MDGPLVSVIVGVYNKERFVGECLQSVLGQTYRNWELIVVDDASTDGSLAEVVRVVGADSRARIVRRQKNRGHPGAVRNQAMKIAQGKYIAFLDADDKWKPEKLAIQSAYMEAYPEFPLTHTKCEVIDEGGDVLCVRHGGNLPPAGDCFIELIGHCFICTSTVMVRRDFGSKMGWFREESRYRCGEDYDFFVRCAHDYPIGRPDEILGQYRKMQGSVSREDANWQSCPVDYPRKCLFYRQHGLWADRLSCREMKFLVWQAARENTIYWRAQGNFRHAIWFSVQMMRWKPFSWPTWRQVGGVLLGRR